MAYGPGTGPSDHLVYTLRGPGRQIAQRLRLLGFTREIALDHVNELLAEGRSLVFPLGRTVKRTPQEEAEREFLRDYSADDWVRDLEKAHLCTDPHPLGFGGSAWLMRQLRHAYYSSRRSQSRWSEAV